MTDDSEKTPIEKIEAGIEALSILNNPLIRDFFKRQNQIYNAEFMALDLAADVDEYRAVKANLMALNDLQTHLQAIADTGNMYQHRESDQKRRNYE